MKRGILEACTGVIYSKPNSFVALREFSDSGGVRELNLGSMTNEQM
jgi:hypothetical protein